MKTSHFWIGFAILLVAVLAVLAVLFRIVPTANRLDRSLDTREAQRDPIGALTWRTFNGVQATISIPRDPADSDEEHAARVARMLEAFRKKFPIKEE